MIALNDEQTRAVHHVDGPALVLAGAGSGKTRVIIERLAYLVDHIGVPPGRLLALTFTNKAASEMRERAQARLGASSFPAWIGTFHRFGLFVLRRHAKAAGLSSSFTVFDDSDQIALMKRLVKELPKEYPRILPRDVLYAISGYKQRLETAPPESECESPHDTAIAVLARQYHERLAQANAVDFDDLLAIPARILSEDDAIRSDYHDRFHYIHVDEYQDTNFAQYTLAQLLAGDRANLFVVGDEDQSIYSWRGADINNILDFENDYPGAAVYRLEENYRSVSPILKVANAVVEHNVQRLGKTLYTKVKGGDAVRYYEAANADAEAQFIVDDITQRGIDPSTAAVLYRVNTQSRTFEEALRRAGMVYRVVGGVQFYQRKEVKDLIAYLRVMANPDDDVALLRVINTPSRGIGASTVDQLTTMAKLRNVSIMRILRESEGDESITTRARRSIDDFVNLIDAASLVADQGSLKKTIEHTVDSTGYRGFIEQSDEKDFRNRIEIVDEFINACAEYDARGPAHIADFLQDLSLVSDTDDIDAAKPCLTLLTCHSAKGLEFEHVYLVGMEEGLLPHAISIGDDEEVEEERRLCYVAMTRARRSLTLSSAQVRMLYGDRRTPEPSRFIREIPHGALQPLTREADEFEDDAEEADTAAAAGAMKTGARVWHEKFGKGVVMFTRGAGKKMRIKVRFDTGRSREFMLSAAPIRVLER